MISKVKVNVMGKLFEVAVYIDAILTASFTKITVLATDLFANFTTLVPHVKKTSVNDDVDDRCTCNEDQTGCAASDKILNKAYVFFVSQLCLRSSYMIPNNFVISFCSFISLVSEGVATGASLDVQNEQGIAAARVHGEEPGM